MRFSTLSGYVELCSYAYYITRHTTSKMHGNTMSSDATSLHDNENYIDHWNYLVYHFSSRILLHGKGCHMIAMRQSSTFNFVIINISFGLLA